MPTYTFQDKNTDEHIDIFMKIKELDQYKKNNPHLIQRIYQPPGFVGRGLNINKLDDDFKNKLKGLQKFYKGNTIDV